MATKIEIDEHRVFLFYSQLRNEADWNKPPLAGNMEQLLNCVDSCHWLYPQARDKIKSEYRNKKIWECANHNLPVGEDLHPHIRSALGAKVKNGRKIDDADTKVYSLTNYAKNILISGKSFDPCYHSFRTKIVFRNASNSRIRKSLGYCKEQSLEDCYLSIEDISAVCFRTGWIIYKVSCQIVVGDGEPVHDVWLKESLANLAKINQLVMCSQSVSADECIQSESFSLGQLIRVLGGNSQDYEKQRRVFTTTYVKINKRPPEEDLSDLLMRLSRHYTDAYKIDSIRNGIENIDDFMDIKHVYVMEGSATTVIDNDPSSHSFQTTYLNNRYISHYLPIVIWSLHEYYQLLNLTNDSRFWPKVNGERDDKQTIDELIELRNRVLQFKLCFRYSAISNITMHNQAYNNLRRVLGLDQLLNQLDRDVTDIASFLEKRSTDMLNDKLRGVTLFGSGFVAFWSVFKLFSIIQVDYLKTGGNTIDLVVVLFISLCAGAGASYLLWRKGK